MWIAEGHLLAHQAAYRDAVIRAWAGGATGREIAEEIGRPSGKFHPSELTHRRHGP